MAWSSALSTPGPGPRFDERTVCSESVWGKVPGARGAGLRPVTPGDALDRSQIICGHSLPSPAGTAPVRVGGWRAVKPQVRRRDPLRRRPPTAGRGARVWGPRGQGHAQLPHPFSCECRGARLLGRPVRGWNIDLRWREVRAGKYPRSELPHRQDLLKISRQTLTGGNQSRRACRAPWTPAKSLHSCRNVRLEGTGSRQSMRRAGFRNPSHFKLAGPLPARREWPVRQERKTGRADSCAVHQ